MPPNCWPQKWIAIYFTVKILWKVKEVAQIITYDFKLFDCEFCRHDLTVRSASYPRRPAPLQVEAWPQFLELPNFAVNKSWRPYFAVLDGLIPKYRRVIEAKLRGQQLVEAELRGQQLVEAMDTEVWKSHEGHTLRSLSDWDRGVNVIKAELSVKDSWSWRPYLMVLEWLSSWCKTCGCFTRMTRIVWEA